MKTMKGIVYLFLLFILMSCIKKVNLYEEKENEGGNNTPTYIYPYGNEVRNATAEIIIKIREEVSIEEISTEIPFLKYNKSWLCLLTQDDCKQAAYSCTWAAINGKPLSYQYFYNAVQLQHKDLPPDSYSLGKTLGSTDGTGNEVRFAFTTTISPEWKWMDKEIAVNPGYNKDYFRFFQQEGLVWGNVIEMLNYGNGIAFHNVNIDDETNVTTIKKHFGISQDIILNRLQDRGCKMLAEPGLTNGTYLTAAYDYQPIQVIAAQTSPIKLYPFKVIDDLQNRPLDRGFYSIESAKQEIVKQRILPKEDRTAINIGVHGTDDSWVKFLLFLNDTYGKDGDDSIWFPSMEEYYEYNYYRVHGGTPQIEYIDAYTLKLTVNLPSGEYFYYPSVTVNLHGINLNNVVSIVSNDDVTGFSYSDYDNGLMFNIDCRKSLMEHAIHFVELYEKDKSNYSNKADAIYFINMLKDAPRKIDLLKRIK